MLVKFIKDYYPKGGPTGNRLLAKYRAGKLYELKLEEAWIYIASGYAEKVAKIVNKPQPNQTLSHGTDISLRTNELLHALKIKPQPKPNNYKLRLPIDDKATRQLIESKQLAQASRDYFRSKNVRVGEIVNLLASLLDYGVDIKDEELIRKVSGDILTLKRLTDHYERNHNDGQK